MWEFKKIMIEGSIALTFALLIETFAGSILQSKAEALESLAFILLLIPAVDNMTGTIGTVLVARLSTALQLGTIEPGRGGRALTDNLEGIAIVSLVTMLYLVILSLTLSSTLHLPMPNPLSIVFMLLSACSLSTILIVLTGLFLSMLTFKRGMDPNIAAMPIITALGDVYGISSLLFFTLILGL